ncbi:uncharacterized protein LOC131229183 [Magnolia sinica]|uniref:uncharacterized protein LOC131229183 n=1 Tax=Magnolia sinica TaxID=86752 RepID=UPI0026592A95|nr:uncharacterized protein LOC131229183 [Magnolia sinica]
MEASSGSNSHRIALDCSNNEISQESRIQSPKFEISDSGIPQAVGPDQRFYSMNALEILRETIRILRFNSTCFLAIAAVLICPVSAILLSNALVNQSIVKRLTVRLLLLARSCGLPLIPSLKQSCQRLSEMVASAAFCFPFYITFLLLAKAAIVYSVACTYAGKKVAGSKFFATVAKIWRRVLVTYMWVCMAIIGCVALFMVLLVIVCNIFVLVCFPSELIVYPALVVEVVFAVVFAHAIIVCNLATVISVLEDVSGPQAFLRSVFLIKGQTQVGLLIFLGSTIGMTFVEGLFEHRVKTLSYGDGSSRIWEGPLLVVMYSFVVLVDYMMSAVFYFTCRSSSLEAFDGDGQTLVESYTVSTG